MNQLCRALWVLVMLTSLAWAQGAAGADADGSGRNNAPGQIGTAGRPPNILFIILDDVGIDQMRVFGYGGSDAARTPNIDAIAHAGVRFRNVWAMPECSPSRAVLFEGRFPLRTNVMSALLDDDLANSQVSPFEVTTPKILKKRGYVSANFGKFHLAQPANNPYGYGIVAALGWDYFDGFLDGAPHPIDTTAGLGDAAPASYSCGFVPNAERPGGADSGACRFLGNSCQAMSATPAHPTPGRDCLEQGGIFVPNATCDDPPPATIAFQNQNGYYAWERVINHADGRVEIIGPQDDPSARRYMGKAVTDSAVSWITGRKGNQKWMVTAAYPQIHTPYQQVPQSLLPPDSDDLSNVDCTPNLPNGQGIANYHLLSNQMLESMDSEIGRLLVQTGLASYNADGSLNYQPEKTDTMVVVIGDNGTYGAGVKEPFDPSRSKGYVYQTGVWVPLIVAGPMVRSPDRHVASMVNVADVFELFGEIAGIDVHQAVPASHILDSQPMLAYLTNPNQASIRQTNFTQTGANIHPTAPPPCVISVTGAPICIQLFTSQGVCEVEGGQWYGPPATVQFTSCCAVQNAHLAPYPDGVTIVPDFQSAIRNDGFKLVQMSVPDCSQQPDDQGQFPDVTLNEFYQINEAVPPELDKDGTALCADTLASGVVTQNCPNTLTQQQAAVYNSLYTSLASPNGILNSEPECPGDGNLDKVVDQKDVHLWKFFSQQVTDPDTGASSSWYDFNRNGFTDGDDLQTILTNLGTKCVSKK